MVELAFYQIISIWSLNDSLESIETSKVFAVIVMTYSVLIVYRHSTGGGTLSAANSLQP